MKTESKDGYGYREKKRRDLDGKGREVPVRVFGFPKDDDPISVFYFLYANPLKHKRL